MVIYFLNFNNISGSEADSKYSPRMWAIDIKEPKHETKVLLDSNEYLYYNIDKEISIGIYKPEDLVLLDSKLTFRKIYVSNIIIPDLVKLIEDAKRDGLDLKVVSGFRSYEDQRDLFEIYVQSELQKANYQISREQAEANANKYSAKPGHSEHQLGTAIDILSSETNYVFSSDDNLKYVMWLENNSSKYNFRISYNKSNTQYIYEPWHLRWFPKERM